MVTIKAKESFSEFKRRRREKESARRKATNIRRAGGSARVETIGKRTVVVQVKPPELFTSEGRRATPDNRGMISGFTKADLVRKRALDVQKRLSVEEQRRLSEQRFVKKFTPLGREVVKSAAEKAAEQRVKKLLAEKAPIPQKLRVIQEKRKKAKVPIEVQIDGRTFVVDKEKITVKPNEFITRSKINNLTSDEKKVFLNTNIRIQNAKKLVEASDTRIRNTFEQLDRFYGKIPGLKGNNFVQQTIRNLLSTASTTVNIFVLADIAVSFSVIGFALAETNLRPGLRNTLNKLTGTTRIDMAKNSFVLAVKGLGQSFNPTTPQGLANIIFTVAVVGIGSFGAANKQVVVSQVAKNANVSVGVAGRIISKLSATVSKFKGVSKFKRSTPFKQRVAQLNKQLAKAKKVKRLTKKEVKLVKKKAKKEIKKAKKLVGKKGKPVKVEKFTISFQGVKKVLNTPKQVSIFVKQMVKNVSSKVRVKNVAVKNLKKFRKDETRIVKDIAKFKAQRNNRIKKLSKGESRKIITKNKLLAREILRISRSISNRIIRLVALRRKINFVKSRINDVIRIKRDVAKALASANRVTKGKFKSVFNKVKQKLGDLKSELKAAKDFDNLVKKIGREIKFKEKLVKDNKRFSKLTGKRLLKEKKAKVKFEKGKFKAELKRRQEKFKKESVFIEKIIKQRRNRDKLEVNKLRSNFKKELLVEKKLLITLRKVRRSKITSSNKRSIINKVKSFVKEEIKIRKIIDKFDERLLGKEGARLLKANKEAKRLLSNLKKAKRQQDIIIKKEGDVAKAFDRVKFVELELKRINGDRIVLRDKLQLLKGLKGEVGRAKVKKQTVKENLDDFVVNFNDAKKQVIKRRNNKVLGKENSQVTSGAFKQVASSKFSGVEVDTIVRGKSQSLVLIDKKLSFDIPSIERVVNRRINVLIPVARRKKLIELGKIKPETFRVVKPKRKRGVVGEPKRITRRVIIEKRKRRVVQRRVLKRVQKPVSKPKLKRVVKRVVKPKVKRVVKKRRFFRLPNLKRRKSLIRVEIGRALARIPGKFRPSLVAVVFNLRALKKPERITGVEIRRIVDKLAKEKEEKGKRKGKKRKGVKSVKKRVIRKKPRK